MFLMPLRRRPYLIGRPVFVRVRFTRVRPFASLVRTRKAVFLEFDVVLVLVLHFLFLS